MKFVLIVLIMINTAIAGVYDTLSNEFIPTNTDLELKNVSFDPYKNNKPIKTQNNFFKASHLMWLNKEKLKLLIPDISFSQSKDYKPKFMYSQYQDGCNNKEKMLMVFLEHIKFYVPNFPKYRITQEVIQPSIDTIESSGEWWIDGCTWKGNICVDKIISK